MNTPEQHLDALSKAPDLPAEAATTCSCQTSQVAEKLRLTLR